MCRNIKTLFNFEPPATNEEIRAASIQFVRKVSGTSKPSCINEVAFEKAVARVAETMQTLLDALVTSAQPKDRQAETAKAKLRNAKRFANAATQAN